MSQPETIEIEDLNQFVQVLTSWHTNKVKTLEHMLQLPEGSEMECDGKSVVMSGDVLAGFQAGITLSLMELGKLPFGYETEEDPTAQTELDLNVPA